MRYICVTYALHMRHMRYMTHVFPALKWSSLRISEVWTHISRWPGSGLKDGVP